MGRCLHVVYEILPPSDNHIRSVQYRMVRGKRKAVIGYTKEAEDYKNAFVQTIGDDFFDAIQEFAAGHKPWMVYRLEILLCFPPTQLLNKGWLEKWASDSRPGTKIPHKKGERKAKTPYKGLDTLNRRKLLEDGLSEAIAIDDSLFWESGGVKLVLSDCDPRVELILEEIPPALYGIPPEYTDDA